MFGSDAPHRARIVFACLKNPGDCSYTIAVQPLPITSFAEFVTSYGRAMIILSEGSLYDIMCFFASCARVMTNFECVILSTVLLRLYYRDPNTCLTNTFWGLPQSNDSCVLMSDIQPYIASCLKCEFLERHETFIVLCLIVIQLTMCGAIMKSGTARVLMPGALSLACGTRIDPGR